ncbi:carbohydrate ABC transporter permease (plasmid) [Rhizobium leguminosarum]|uniref:Binding-protein-dependent transport system inner membrane component family protein n=1 Tax=Rhizobium leguminosarum TaxID=384 RepID=A0A2Z4YV68_RHILE|nr:sugar ABC transporter permease [Rhizobium leguminosarum]MDH6662380.1 raffinose/stachyose/melibiose transport system permease protein [Rhizobium sophorae]AXA44405.1 Binding-protein-dependent transport system inner membrane component family protein [Rhizobium leguminosarum]MBA9032198.1 raffinose/stachyose/melibiose transport system permease protein [Rhizobium leguminosarum]MBB4525306.1 raffinose/stachyose/melibiose transport system permease protein [Rhizobium leguminosarum]TBZ39922.1 sugar AB
MAISSQLSSDGSRSYSLYLIPGTIGFILIVLIPQLANLGLSFTAWKGVGTPRPVGLQNYHRLLTDDQFWGSMYHTLLFIVSMTVIPVCIGLVLAALLFDYVRDQFGEWVSSFFRAGFYLPQILPVTVAGVLWGWILNPVGVINITLKAIGLDNLAQNWIGDATYALAAVSLVIVWIQVGYCLVVFMAGLSRIDPSLYEAAELDGANWWSRLVTITIPLLAPEIFVVVLTTLIAALKVFAPIFVITAGGPDNATLVPSYLTYYHFFTTQRVGYAAAIAVVQTTLTIALAVIFLRFQSQQESKE